MRKSVTTPAAAIMLGFALAATAGAQEKKPQAAPDEKAVMEAMAKAGTPGEAHKKLDPMIGTFDAKVTSWMDPSKPPVVNPGTAERKWVLGNRYVQENFQSSFMDQPFSGIGYTAYDNIGKEYVSVWMDSMSTGVMTMKGAASGNSISEAGTMLDPVTGKPSNLKTKFTMTDEDHHLFEMWAPAPDGKMYKMMEIAYTRKK